VQIRRDQGRGRGIINDPVLLRLGRDRFWLSVADSDVLLWAKGVAVNSGMDVQVGEPDVWPLQVQGPRSKDLMALLFGEPVLSLRYYFSASWWGSSSPVLL
jgi:glycine cleavage system aminomethyltransferase T